MCVASVDGVPVPQPVSEGQSESLISRLGDAGIAAVADGRREQAETGVGAAGDLSGN